jgi:hyperosmotically inducible protein
MSRTILALAMTFTLSFLPTNAIGQPGQDSEPQLRSVSDGGRDERFLSVLSAAVRHELVTLPYYDVFDWLEAEVSEDGKVVLRGFVVNGQTRRSAEARMKRIESVREVVNEIELLPPGEDALRIAAYRAIYSWDSPLFRYATRAMPPIHIIVKNGRATLKGVVQSDSHRQYAASAVRSVAGLFEVQNELAVE